MSKTPSKPIDSVVGSDVVQFVVHGAMVPALASWLRASGFQITPWPVEDDLPTYLVVPAP